MNWDDLNNHGHPFDAIKGVPTPPDLANIDTIGSDTVLQLTSTAGSEFDRFSGTNDPEGDHLDVVLVDKNQVAEDGLIVLNAPATGVTVAPPASGAFLVTANGPAQWRRRGVAEGQRVRYTSAGGPVFGTISSLTDNSFTMTENNATTGSPVAASSFVVFSGKEVLRVKKAHSAEDFGPAEPGANNIDINNIKRITDEGGDLGGFGAGDDIVTIDPLLRIPVRLNGGDGSDTITGGAAGAILLGGEGNDVLSLAAAPSDLSAAERLTWNSRMEGGGGDDLVTSGPGDDLILGGEGNDTLDGGAADREVLSGQDFGNTPLKGNIRGTKFNDFNRNGIQDAGEVSLSGWTIYIDANNNAQLDAGEISFVTGSNGNYNFQNVEAGTHIVRDVPQAGWDQTSPGNGFLTVILAPGQNSTGNNFGNVFGVIRGTPGADQWYVRNNPGFVGNIQVFAGSSAAGIQLFELQLAQVSSLRFDALGGNDTLTVDFGVGFGNPVPAGGIELDGGSGFDLLDYRQFGAPFSVNLLAGTATATGGISGIESFVP
jgi:hypothetical protein